MATYDVVNEAAIAATPAEIVDALLEEAAGRSQWWQPLVRMRQRGDKPLPEIGAVVDIAVRVAGLPGLRVAAVRYTGRVTAFEPGRRLVLEYVGGDFRGGEEWTLDRADAGHTRIATRWKTDPQGMVRLLARLADVPGTYSQVMQEGFRGIERFTADRRSRSQA
jgi:hypothetical protein